MDLIHSFCVWSICPIYDLFTLYLIDLTCIWLNLPVFDQFGLYMISSTVVNPVLFDWTWIWSMHPGIYQCDLQPVPKAYRKCCVKFLTTPSVWTGFPAVIQHSLSNHFKCLKSKTWNNLTSSSANLFFFRAQNALCCKTGGAIIGLQVSKQDGMVSSSPPICLSLVRVNPPIPTQFWCRNQKIWGKRISSLKSTGKWKSQIMDGVCAGSWSLISLQMSFDRIDTFPPAESRFNENFVDKMSRVGLALVSRRR